MGGGGSGSAKAQPMIGGDLRPDLSQGAYQQEEDQQLAEQMRQGSAHAKRLYDSGGRS